MLREENKIITDTKEIVQVLNNNQLKNLAGKNQLVLQSEVT